VAAGHDRRRQTAWFGFRGRQTVVSFGQFADERISAVARGLDAALERALR
jgi:hypothetical protein